MARDIKDYYGFGNMAVNILMQKLSVAKNQPGLTVADLAINGSNIGGELAPPPAGMRYTAYIHNNRPVAMLVNDTQGMEQRNTSRMTSVTDAETQTQWLTQAQRSTQGAAEFVNSRVKTAYYIRATRGSVAENLGELQGGWCSDDADAIIDVFKAHNDAYSLGWTITKHTLNERKDGPGDGVTPKYIAIPLTADSTSLLGYARILLNPATWSTVEWDGVEAAKAALPSTISFNTVHNASVVDRIAVLVPGINNVFVSTPGETTQTTYSLSTSRTTTTDSERQTEWLTDVAEGQHQTSQSTLHQTTVQTAPDGAPTKQTAAVTAAFTNSNTQYDTTFNLMTTRETEVTGISSRNTASSTAYATTADTGVSSATVVMTTRETLQERIDKQQTFYNYNGQTTRETTAEHNTTKTRMTQNAEQTSHLTDISGFQPQLERTPAAAAANDNQTWVDVDAPHRTYNSAMSAAAGDAVNADPADYTGGYRAVAANFSAQTVFYGKHSTEYEAATGTTANTSFATIKSTGRETDILGYYMGNTQLATAAITLSDVVQTQRMTQHNTVVSTIVDDGTGTVQTEYETQAMAITDRVTQGLTDLATSWDTVTEGSLLNTQADTVYDTTWYTSGTTTPRKR